MIPGLKELIVVLGLTLPVWFLFGSVAVRSSSREVFNFRRNIWIFITVIGQLSPSLWVYLMACSPILYIAGRRDPNPTALFVLMLFAVPNAVAQIPSIGIEIFPIGHRRILLLTILLPTLFQGRPNDFAARRPKVDWICRLLLTFLLLGLVLDMPHMTLTHALRTALLLCIDTLLIYIAFSRLRFDRSALRDCIEMWVLAASLAGAVAIFEMSRGWLLYTGINSRWGDPNTFAFLLREGSLRAQAAAGHSLKLGGWLAVAWVFFLFIQREWKDKYVRYSIGVVIIGGLCATFARGPWLAAFLSTVIYFSLNPKGSSEALKGLVGFAIILIIIYLSPLGDVIVNYLPFLGHIDSGNVDYRVRLYKVCMGIIKENPFFGNPVARGELESLRQGQGIIDLVNGYLVIAVFHGLIALGLFVGVLTLGLRYVFKVWRDSRQFDPELAYLAASLFAAMAGMILFIATASVEPMVYMLVAMMGSLWWIYGTGQSAAAGAVPSGMKLSRSR